MKRLTAFLLVLVLLFTAPALAAASADDVTRTLRAMEVMVGDETGALHLERSVSRAEFAKLLVASSSVADAVSGEGAGYSLFTDVKSGHWASEYIKLCLDKGWMIGYTDGSFRPDSTVTLEEACTACLRLLGYQSGDLPGSFPAAQLSKAAAVGLRSDVSAQRGDALTRWDCALIFYNLLTCKTAQGQVYATTLGKPLDSEGKVDYVKLAREDVSDPYVWTAGRTLAFTPAEVYLNDRLVEDYAPAPGDVCYENAALRVLWVYTDRVFGQITAVAPTVGRAENVSVGGKSYPLATDAVKAKLAALGDKAVGSVVTLYLGMDGAVADTDAVNGPFVADGTDRLPFTPDVVYRNGALASSAVLSPNEVYYYREADRTLWVCTGQVSGRVEALTPNAISPTAVTVAGKSYPLSGQALSQEMSTLSGKWEGRFVTLLLGLDGSVVAVLSGAGAESDWYGVVKSAVKTTQDGAVEQRLSVLCTDGNQHVFPVSPSRSWEVGDLVKITVTGGGVAVENLPHAYLSGTVGRLGASIGGTPLAGDVQILDVASDGAAMRVEPETLIGLTLSSADVRFYTKNADGQVDRLILNDATGQLWSYGFLSEAATQGGGMNTSARYTLLQNGQSRSVLASGKVFPVTAPNAVAVRFGSDGAVASMTAMKKIALTSLSRSTAQTTGQSYALDPNAQVWMKDGKGEYYPLTLDDVLSGAYTSLTGWYDPWQKEVRVILAQ